jgi:hypothetical protein
MLPRPVNPQPPGPPLTKQKQLLWRRLVSALFCCVCNVPLVLYTIVHSSHANTLRSVALRSSPSQHVWASRTAIQGVQALPHWPFKVSRHSRTTALQKCEGANLTLNEMPTVFFLSLPPM